MADRAFIDGVPALAWSALPDASPEHFEKWKLMLHPDDVAPFTGWWPDRQASRKPGQTEVRFRRFDGEYRWFQVAAAPVQDELGNIVRWYGINTDIDNRKRAEQQVRQHEGDL